MTNRLACFVWSAVFLFIANACAYRLGTSFDSGDKIFIIVRNDSLAPQLGPLVNRAIKEVFIKKGIYAISSNRDHADLFLTVTLKNYQNTPESFRKNDSLLASGFKLDTNAEIELRDSRGVQVRESKIQGNSSIFRSKVTSEPRSEQALQALAEDLANQVYLSILSRNS